MKKILLMAFMLINIQSYAQHKKYDNTPNFSKGRAHVTLNGKWGVIDETGKEVIPVKYDALEYFYGNSSMAKASLNGKWGFIDKLGNEIIPIKYDWIGNFWRSLAMVSLDGKWGLVDNTGREVTPVKYAKLGVFSEGLAPVSLNGKWGFIDETGEEVIPIKYDDFERFTDGIAKVSISGKWGTIDKYGTEKGFSETLAKNQEEQPSNVTLADSYAQNAPTFVKYLIGKATYRQEDRCYYVEVPNSVKLNLKELIKSFAELENLSLANYATSTEIVNGRTFVFNGKTRSNVYKYDYVTAFTFRKINWKLDGPDAGLLLKDKKNTIEKSVQAALEAGKFENAYYVAYYQGIEKSKVAKWLKKHSQLVVIKDDDTRFQFTTSREEAISYVDKKRKFEADVAYKKKLFADVNEKVFKKNGSWFYTLELDNVDLAIETKEKYPDFILNLDRLGLTASHYVGEYKHWNNDRLSRFIAAFPEFPFMMDMAWKHNQDKIEDFIKYFKDYAYAENKIYTDLQTAYAGKSTSALRTAFERANSAVPLIGNNIDVSRINALMLQCFDKDLKLCTTATERIESYMTYTGKKYFSRSTVAGYYVSADDFKQLIAELRKCTPLLQQSQSIESDIHDTYFAKRFESGVAEWKSLTVDFPDRKNQIIACTRRFIISKSYYNSKWSANINAELKETGNVIRGLVSYINANVPDNEGMQSAKKNLADAYNIQTKYQNDLHKAESYESQIKSQIRKIREAVEKTQIIPPYNIKKRSRNVASERLEDIDIRIVFLPADVYAHYDYDDRIYYSGGGGLTTRDNEAKSLDECMLKFVKHHRFITQWDRDLERVENLEKAEKIIEQFKRYGINEWYKIEYFE